MSTREPSSLRRRLGAIGILVLSASLLAGCYVGPAPYWGHGGGGGGYHHGYDHYR